MTTALQPSPDPTVAPGGAVRAAARRMWALTRAELRLLVRNRMALFMSLAMPIAAAFLFAGLDVAERMDASLGATVIVLVASFAILFVVYYNLVATYAQRREDLVLKRLRSGELTDAEILAGTAVASLAVALGQILVIGVAAPLLFDLAVPVNPVLVVAGVLLGSVAFVPLAAASAIFTRNAEMAQITTLPVVLVCTGFSGLVAPLDVLPDTLARVVEFLPLTPVVELMRIGLLGVTADGTTVSFGGSFGAAVPSVLVLLAWTAIGVAVVRRSFRWEPRR